MGQCFARDLSIEVVKELGCIYIIYIYAGYGDCFEVNRFEPPEHPLFSFSRTPEIWIPSFFYILHPWDLNLLCSPSPAPLRFESPVFSISCTPKILTPCILLLLHPWNLNPLYSPSPTPLRSEPLVFSFSYTPEIWTSCVFLLLHPEIWTPCFLLLLHPWDLNPLYSPSPATLRFNPPPLYSSPAPLRF